MSDADRYMQLGNAVTVNVAEYLARRMAPLLQQAQDTQANSEQHELVCEHHEPAHGFAAGAAGSCVAGVCPASLGASPMSCGATSSCASEAAAAAQAPASDV